MSGCKRVEKKGTGDGEHLNHLWEPPDFGGRAVCKRWAADMAEVATRTKFSDFNHKRWLSKLDRVVMSFLWLS
jgi:hypothetical protein